MNHTQTEISQPLLVSELEASKMLGISDRTLFKMRKAGAMPHVRIGHRVLYSVESLKEFILQNEKGGDSHE